MKQIGIFHLKRKFKFIYSWIIILSCTLLCACTTQTSDSKDIIVQSTKVIQNESRSEIVLSDCLVFHDEEDGRIMLKVKTEEFNDIGFEFGDSVNVQFLNGYKLEDVPYYNGSYVFDYELVMVGKSKDEYIAISIKRGEDLYKEAKLNDGDTATVTLNEKQKYIKRQIAMDIDYSNNRDDYKSDEVFANFRNVTIGNLKKNILYRSASPCDNRNKRSSYVDKLIRSAGINFVMNMSDDKEHIEYYFTKDDYESPYYKSLYENGNVIPLCMMVDYHRADFAPSLIKGFTELSKHEGPYLIHCIEGKDRTGFACLVLEALAGATYQEMLDDYMITYDNYFGINEKTDPKRYEALVETSFEPMLMYLSGKSGADKLSEIDYRKYAREYLLKNGMSEKSLNELIDRIVK